MCALQGFRVRCVSRYWHLTLKNRNELGETIDSTGKWKAGCFFRFCLVFRDWGQRTRVFHNKWSAQSWKGDWGSDLEERYGEQMSPSCLLAGRLCQWLLRNVYCSWGLNNRMSRGRLEICVICRRWGQKGEGGHRRWVATELGRKQRLNLEKRKERRMSAVGRPASWLQWPVGPQRMSTCSLIPLFDKHSYDKNWKHQFQIQI